MGEIQYGELCSRDAERIKAQKIATLVASSAAFKVLNFGFNYEVELNHEVTVKVGKLQIELGEEGW